MKKAILIMVVCIAACAAVFAGGSKEGDTYTLRISTSQTEQSLITRTYQELADQLNEKSGGRLNVTVFPSGQLGSDEDVLEQAILGSAVAVNTDAARMGTYVYDMGILMMGYLFDTYEECAAVTETATFQSWIEQLAAEHGIRILSFKFYDGPRNFVTNKPINTPADLKGLTIRTIGSPVCVESIGALGATPTSMTPSEVYNAIQSKAIDGFENQDTSTFSSRYFEVCKYLTRTEHFQLMQGLVCGEKWFQTLPEDLQQLILTTADEVGEASAQRVIEESLACEEQMAAQGMVIVNPDKTPFKEAMIPAYEKMGYTELREQLYAEIGKTV